MLTSPTPFWPSRRLWLKFFIGLVYAPLFFVLLFWLFIPAALLRGLYLVLFFLLFAGGPISVGIFLSPGRRGVTAGLVTAIAIPVIWYFAGIAADALDFTDIDVVLQLGLAAASVAILLEVMSGDAGEKAEMFGLGVGLVVGLFLIFVNTALVGAFHYKGNDASMLFSLYPPNALVWLSTLFFPEWLSRRVGWGGGIVWTVLISVVLGLSFMLMK